MGYTAASHQEAEEADFCTTFGDFSYRPFFPVKEEKRRVAGVVVKSVPPSAAVSTRCLSG